MKKLLKIVFVTLVALLAIALVAVLTLPLWIGPVATTAANRTVPGITGTDFNLGEFGLNFYSGRLHVGALRLANPVGYSHPDAVTVGAVDVDLDVASALSDTVVFREIAIRDVFVSYVSKDGTNNFDQISANVAQATGGGEAAEQPPAEEEPSGEGEKSKKKVVIDKLTISGISVQWGIVPISLPATITLTGIGRDSGGTDWSAAASEVIDAVLKQLGALGSGIIDLGGALKDLGVKSAGEAMDAVSSTLGAATDALGSASGSAAEAATSVVEGAGKALSGVTSGAGDAAGSAVEGAGKVIGGAADAVMDGAGKAVDATSGVIKDAGSAIKGLFGK